MEVSTIACRYCPCFSTSKDVLSHLSIHVLNDKLFSHFCKLCNNEVVLNSTAIIIAHIRAYHNMDLICPFCENNMQDLNHLCNHLNKFMITIYRCEESKCTYKSCDKNELKEHLLLFKHRSNMAADDCKYICNLRLGISLNNEKGQDLEFLKKAIGFNMVLQYNMDSSVNMNPMIQIKNSSKSNKYNFDMNDNKKIKKISKLNKSNLDKNEKKNSKLNKDNFDMNENKKVKKSNNDNFISVYLQSNVEQRILTQYVDIDLIKVDLLFNMDYSDLILNKLLKEKDNPISYNLMFKLRNVRFYSIGVSLTQKQKLFICMDCKYSSQNCHEDIKRHILSTHCLLNMCQIKLVMMTTLHDSNFELYSDSDILHFINQNKLKLDNIKNKRGRIFFRYNQNHHKINHQIYLKDVDKIFLINYSTIVLMNICKNFKYFKNVVSKLEMLKQYMIGVKVYKQFNIYVCMNCGYSVECNSNSVRRHILRQHCKFSKLQANSVLKSCSINWRGKFISYQEMIDLKMSKNIEKIRSNIKRSRNVKSHDRVSIKLKPSVSSKTQESNTNPIFHNNSEITEISETFNMDYSDLILKKLCKKESQYDYNSIVTKIKNVRSYLIGVIVVGDKRSYICMECKYLTKYIHGWIRRHILYDHCLLDELEVTLVMMTSMYYKDLSFYTDQDILHNINCIKLGNSEDVLSDLENEAELDTFDEQNKIHLQSSKCFDIDLGNVHRIYEVIYSDAILKRIVKDKSTLECVRNKLANLKSHFVGVYHMCFILRVYVCMSCKYSSYYSRDIRIHILSFYCDLNEEHINLAFKACKINWHGKVMSYDDMISSKEASENNGNLLSIEDSKEVQSFAYQKKDIEHNKPKKNISYIIKETFFMEYSSLILKKLCGKGDIFNYNSLMLKLKDIKSFLIGVVEVGVKVSYVCLNCQFLDVEFSHDDVRKHVLAQHCLLTDAEVQLVMKTSIYYKESWFFSNCNILNLVNVERFKNDEELLSDIENETCDDYFIRKYASNKKGYTAKWRRKSNVEFNVDKIEKIFEMFYSEESLDGVLQYEPSVLKKLENLGNYLIGVSEIEKSLIYTCITCESSYDNYNNIRRHIINVHCDLDTLETTFAIKACKLKKSMKTKCYYDEGSLTINQLLEKKHGQFVCATNKNVDMDSIEVVKECSVIISKSVVANIDQEITNTEIEVKETFHMDYSDRILKIFFKDEYVFVYDNIMSKLQGARDYLIGVVKDKENKSYVCMKCQYLSTHGHRLIRIHILRQHCFLSEPQVTLVMMTSLFGADLKLSRDEDIITFINGNKWDSTIYID